MSFFSSLCLFYPGKPPQITVGELRRFSAQLREIIPFKTFFQSIELKYGDSTSADLESTNLMKEVYPNMWQHEEYSWDHRKPNSRVEPKRTFLARLRTMLGRGQQQNERRETEPWENLWPASEGDSRSLYRASLDFGYLPPEVCRELEASDPAREGSYICPDSASLRIDPFSPATLADEEERDVVGWVTLRFPGNGYFSWRGQPFETYWQEARTKPTLQRVQSLCRDQFPVPPLPFLDEMKADLGPLFMNRDEYREGDWGVTVSETG